MCKKYLHCGNCWSVLGEIPASDPKRIFDTMDCSWECGCGRLNLSSDGLIEKYDNNRDAHHIYIRGDKESSLVDRIPNGFNFSDDFSPGLFNKL